MPDNCDPVFETPSGAEVRRFDRKVISDCFLSVENLWLDSLNNEHSSSAKMRPVPSPETLQGLPCELKEVGASNHLALG
jgi:hypothetical protein